MKLVLCSHLEKGAMRREMSDLARCLISEWEVQLSWLFGSCSTSNWSSETTGKFVCACQTLYCVMFVHLKKLISWELTLWEVDLVGGHLEKSYIILTACDFS